MGFNPSKLNSPEKMDLDDDDDDDTRYPLPPELSINILLETLETSSSFRTFLDKSRSF